MGFLVTTNLTTRLTQLAATFLAEWPQRGLMGAEELGKSTAVEPRGATSRKMCAEDEGRSGRELS
jgi:hypothetical protein